MARLAWASSAVDICSKSMALRRSSVEKVSVASISISSPSPSAGGGGGASAPSSSASAARRSAAVGLWGSFTPRTSGRSRLIMCSMNCGSRQ
jgi:hypothetical protein